MEIRIVGIPVAQGRPRFSRVNGFMRAYDPTKSREWKEAVKLQAIDQGITPMRGALKMTAVFNLPRPKSLPTKVIHHIKKPDCSNFIKGVEDALRGIAFDDDSQIVELHIRKMYGIPGVDITINEV